MKARLIALGAGLCASACVTSLFGQNPLPGDALPGRYIVQLRDGVTPQEISQRHGLAPDHLYGWAINGFSGFVPPGVLRKLATDPDVIRIAPNRLVTAIGKPDRSGGGGGKGGKPGSGEPPPPPPPAGQIIPAGVMRIGAPVAHTAGFTGTGVGVAIVDTGIDFDHTDLFANILLPSHSSFPELTAQDDHAHGTHVAGIVAAVDNTQDVIGVAPHAGLYAVKVLDSWGDGSDADVIAGLDWIVANAAGATPPIRVANMSLGRPASSDDSLMHDAIRRVVVEAGVTVVAAAGNTCSAEVPQIVPAGFPEVIAVASSTAQNGAADRKGQFIPADTASYFSTDGAYDPNTGIGVGISAPGETQEDIGKGGALSSVGIESTLIGGGTVGMSGTSMAAPHVTGAVALLLQKDPGLSPDEVRMVLMMSAKGNGAGGLPRVSSTACQSGNDGDSEGILDVVAALALLP